MAQAERALQNGQIDVAEQKLRDLLRQDENNVITLAKLAAVMLEKKDLEEADRLLQKATTVDPLDPASNYLLGILRYQQERYDEAFNALSLSSRANPEKPETQYFLGLTLLKKGNREPAETAFRKAIQLRPGWGMAHYELAFVYATQKPPYKELAEWHYQKAVSGGAPRNFELEALIEKAAPKSDAATE
jgi:predicted Zn-dependent protease